MIVEITTRGILFDMDGVLISSTGADERSWRRWARLRNMEGTFSIQSLHGRRTIDTVRDLRPDLDPFEEQRILEGFDAEDRDGLLVLPGVMQLLSTLPADCWTIVTSASGPLMLSRLTYAGVPIPRAFVSADKVTHGKPHPEPYQAGATLLKLPPADCLVIEDAPAGIAAGEAAGCKVLGILSSHRSDELKQADWLVSSLEDITVNAKPDGLLYITLRTSEDKHAGHG